MINIKPLERTRSCNTCENDATQEIKFKDIFSQGGTVLTLCDECIIELRERLTNEVKA